MDIHSDTIWTVREAKSRLSEILRRARKKGPQYIGKHEQCVLISRDELEARTEPNQSLSVWLLQHAPKAKLTIPRRGESASRPVPFSDSQ